jgi:hypothetical protein
MEGLNSEGDGEMPVVGGDSSHSHQAPTEQDGEPIDTAESNIDTIEPLAVQIDDEAKLEFKYMSLGEMDNTADLKQPINSPVLLVSQDSICGNEQPQSHADLSIIDKIKTCQLTNKEIINYILNMLVGNSEFDMEKNFVIKNYKTLRCVPRFW